MSMASFNTSNDGLSDNKQSEITSDKPSTNAANNLCIICSTRQRTVAFVPCGHFAVCVPCGHGLKICPTCGSDINALLRIYD